MKRYFEFIGSDGKTEVEHSKFWEAWLDGSSFRTRYGKIGATGQTTVKNFGSEADAEIALEKAIVEKTKKGYVEPSRSEADHEEEEERDISPRLDGNDPEAIAAVVAYEAWAKKYLPLAYIEFELTVAPAGIPEASIWTERSGDYEEFLSNGFQEYSDSSNAPVTGYVIAQNPIEDMQHFESVTTEIRRWCDKCDGEGEIDSEECDYCEGAGTQYFEVSSKYPLVISSHQELEAFAVAAGKTTAQPADLPPSDAKFCAACGTKRESASVKFCGNCGSAHH